METKAYTTRETHHDFWEGERFYLNRKENICLDQTKENKIEIKENSDKRISACRPLFCCSKSIRVETGKYMSKWRVSIFAFSLQKNKWKLGKTRQDYIRCWSDITLMILLRRLSRPSSWVTLQGELGGSRAALSRIFTHMVHLVWVRYGSLVGNIHIWKSFFADFAAHFEQLGAFFENLIGFVDGKLVPTARPGGNE